MKSVDLGIVCAVDEEYTSLSNYLLEKEYRTMGDKPITVGAFNNTSIAIIKSGIGNINSACATTLLYSTYKPHLMLFSGIAGSLNPKLKIGDVLIGKAAFQAEANSHEQLRRTWEMPSLIKTADTQLSDIALSLAENCPYPVKQGMIVSSDIYPAPDDFQALFEEQHAQAIDMETAAFYQVCNGLNIPCLCLRSFSNPVTNSKKEDLHDHHIEKSSTHSSDFCFRLINKLIMENHIASFNSPSNNTAETLVSKLNLEPHPEGGHYKRTYSSESMINVDKCEYGDDTRLAASSIYYLLQKNQFSAWHSVKSDETWFHHQGCSLTIHLIDPKSQAYNTICIGDYRT
ncbi:MAG: 5'-methylthioadenosine/S-adenosylhomocysteine nucleosidase [Coxiellaceae bacterium]|nr:5'-methylthioadenosine/S-adenosylhomocysteine nucleosidase [Coxiellaceae bacterium]